MKQYFNRSGFMAFNPEGTVSTSNIKILERFQSEALHMIVNAPWFLPITVIQKDLQTPTVIEEISCYSSQYSARLHFAPKRLSGKPLGKT
jgi:hypothetical protein